MERVHPQFLMEGMELATEKQDFYEFNKQVCAGLEYWANTLNGEIGSVDPNEVPLIIAALRELADIYAKAVPGSGNIANAFQDMAVKKRVFVLKILK